jgi:DNA mismatch endonuclease (patch repair protein)
VLCFVNMADTFSKEKRSEIMRKVHSFNTKPEQLVRKFLHKQGFRYTLHQQKLPGKPDIVLPKYKTVINVNGCFWHGHEECKRADLPSANRDYWTNKIKRNKDRDLKNDQKLDELGWKVISIYECQITSKKLQETMSAVINKILSNK